MTPRYPDITVRLSGQDGNAFIVLGLILRVMRQHRVTSEERTRFREEAMSGDYDHLLQTCMQWVNVE